MGMYDNVRYEEECECGEVLDDWQSKDGPCMMLTLDAFDVRNFYTQCDRCDKWHEYVVHVKEYILEAKHGEG